MQLIRTLVFVVCAMLWASVWADDAGGRVNINTADAATLAEQLDGVGAARAKAIVSYREAHGPFESADDLTEVSGIGPHVVDRNRERIETSE